MYINAYVAISHFNPRSPHGERPRAGDERGGGKAFQSTLPARGATGEATSGAPAAGDFNPRSPHGERPSGAPAAGGSRDFNPRSPHGERRVARISSCARNPIFQSTLPARGATRWKKSARNRQTHFNPRSPHGERHDTTDGDAQAPPHFNPRSPHGERPARWRTSCGARRFQSTLPARGATSFRHAGVWYIPISIHAPRTGSDQMDSAERADYRISIHAPRTGSDLSRNAFWICAKNFNPRSPHGERQTGSENHLRDTTFQSTLPARGATLSRSLCAEPCIISIHAPRTGSDCIAPTFGQAPFISIHAPRTGSDEEDDFQAPYFEHFNPRSPHGERRVRLRCIK